MKGTGTTPRQLLTILGIVALVCGLALAAGCGGNSWTRLTEAP